MRVPDFLVRQFYVEGSLQTEGDGFRLQARNGIGDGTLVGIGRISVDGTDVDLASVTATREGDPAVHRAADVSRRPRSPSLAATSSRSTSPATRSRPASTASRSRSSSSTPGR